MQDSVVLCVWNTHKLQSTFQWWILMSLKDSKWRTKPVDSVGSHSYIFFYQAFVRKVTHEVVSLWKRDACLTFSLIFWKKVSAHWFYMIFLGYFVCMTFGWCTKLLPLAWYSHSSTVMGLLVVTGLIPDSKKYKQNNYLKCVTANSSTTRQHTAYTTNQPTPPSCQTRATQKSPSLNEKYWRIFWKKSSEELTSRHTKKKRQKE